MALKAEFDVARDQIQFVAGKGGDSVVLTGMTLGVDPATNLATLIKSATDLTVTIKAKTA
jgi:uncharacterized protein YneR